MIGKTPRRLFQGLENPVAALTVAALLASLAVKLYGAWAFAMQPSSDYGRVALMARHMAEGLPWPVFFYGSAYMGTVEPAISAALSAVFGFSGFVVCLGTALAAWCMVWVIRRIGDTAGGPLAALGALLFVLIGPFPFFYYMASPRGGYAVAMTLGLWVLARAARLADAEWDRRPTTCAAYAGLGLAAGIGWWSNPIVTAALLSAAALLAVAMRGRVFRWRIAAGAAGFAIGTLPVWWWNARNGWLTLSMTQSIGGTSPGEGWVLFAARMRELLEGPGWGMAGVVMSGVLVAAGAVAFFAAPRRDRAAGWMRAAVAVFTVVSLALFVRSHFARVPSVRYVLPMVPVLALAVGALFAAAVRRFGPRGGLALAAVVLALHAPALRTGWQARQSDAPAWRGAAVLAEAARAAGIEVLHGDIWTHWLNAAADEAIPVVDLRAEPYPPYDAASERASRIGVLNGIGRIHGYLQTAAVSAEVLTSGTWRVVHAFAPPAGGVTPLDVPAGVSGEASAVTDRDLYTRWTGEGYQTLELTWDGPRALTGLLLLNLDGDSPREVGVEVQDATGAWRWVVRGPLTDWFWSGRRPYFGKIYARGEVRWTEPVADAVAVRLYVNGPRWGVAEVMPLGPGPAAPPLDPGWLAEAADLRRVFTDRGDAEAFAAVAPPGTTVVQPSFLAKDIHTMQDVFRPEHPSIDWIQPGDAFFVAAAWTGQADAVMAAWAGEGGLERRAVPGGAAWVLPADRAPVFAGFHWLGFTAMAWPDDVRAAWRDPDGAGDEETALADFGADLALAGFTAARDDTAGGWRFAWRWRCGPGLIAAEYGVFLHAIGEDGRILFQDDHRLLEEVYARRIADQPGPRVYPVERRVAHEGPEVVAFRVGLLDAATGRRLVPDTDQATHRHALHVPVSKP